MHTEAYDGFGDMAHKAGVLPDDTPLQVLDLGGQNVNGTVHTWFTHPDTVVTTLDLENADIIADATTWIPTDEWDVVICTEVFEHVRAWRQVIDTAFEALRPGGVFIFTCASTNRPPHGATGAPLPAPWEWYGNVDPAMLQRVLVSRGFHPVHVEYQYPPGDAYGYGVK